MPKSNLSRAIRLTPPGAGAIATVRVEGPDAGSVVATCVQARCGRPSGEWPVDRPILGLFGDGCGEPIVVHRRRDGAFELHCHGGLAAVARIERALAHAGAKQVEWKQWLHRQHASPIAAEAQIALAQARTERTAAILLDQYGGALQDALTELERLLATGDTVAAKQQVQALLARAEVGRHLTRPWHVVLAGRPNVGKSSLLNAMLGFERAIVHSTAGTTRDALTATTAIDGWPVQLTDTAGLALETPGAPDTSLSGQAGAIAREQIAAADLVVVVLDRAQPVVAEEEQWLSDWPHALRVDNKSDLPLAAGARPPAIATSAIRGDGVAQLLDAIAQRLVPDPPSPGAAVPFSESHCSQLHTIAEQLGALVSRCTPR